MKNLLTLVAAIAITSAATAQSKTCTVKTACGVKSYKTDSFVKANQSGKTVTVTDGATGSILDTFECDGSKSGTVTTSDGSTITVGSVSAGVQVSCNSSATPTTPEVPTTPQTPSLPDFSNFSSFISSFLSRLSEEDKSRLDTVLNAVPDNFTPKDNSVMVRPELENTPISGSNGDNVSFEGNVGVSEGGTSSVVPTFFDNGVSVQINASAPGK